MRTDYGFNGVLGGANDDISSESWTDDAWHYFIMRRDQNAPYASFQVLKEDKTQWGNKVETTLEYYDDFSPFEFYRCRLLHFSLIFICKFYMVLTIEENSI